MESSAVCASHILILKIFYRFKKDTTQVFIYYLRAIFKYQSYFCEMKHNEVNVDLN